MIEIPLTTEPSQSFSIPLEGTIYKLEVIFNTRTNRWSFSISNSGTLLVSGVYIAGGVDLLAPHALGIKNLFAMNSSDSLEDSDFGALGNAVKLVLFTDEEINSVSSIS